MQAAKPKTFLLAMMLLSGISPLAAHTRTNENSRLGFDASKTSLHQEIEAGRSLNVLGIEAGLRRTHVGSLCTGKERDAETGLDFFGGRVSDRSDDQTPNQSLLARGTSANLPPGLNPGDFISRYYSSAQGRFTSPDRPLLDQYSDDPQSWNLFSYVRNNPLTFFDLNGGECKKTKDGFEGDCVSPGDEKVTQGDKPQVQNVNAQQGSLLDLFMASGVPRYVPNDKPLSEDAQKVLTVAYLRTQHDLGCVGLGGAITGGAVAASSPIIPKPFSAGGTSATSPASRVLGGFNIGKSIPTPVGTPGTSTFAWRASANLGRIAGRYLPYVGTVVGAAATYSCLGSN